MKINDYARERNINPIRLNLGCGGRLFDGWINIDKYPHNPADTARGAGEPDIYADICDLPVLDGTVDQIMLVHVVEHFTRWQTIDNLKHWACKLRDRGLLIVEMPDLDKCIEWYLKGKEAPHIDTAIGKQNMGKTQFYGNQWDRLDYETHRYVWTVSEFIRELNRAGFWIKEASHDARFHQKGRDMWVVAEKVT